MAHERHSIELEVFEMITTYSAAMSNCAKYRDSDGFCTRNCSCSGLSLGGNQRDYDEAALEAYDAGYKRYQLLTGKCGDRYVIPLDEKGRLI